MKVINMVKKVVMQSKDNRYKKVYVATGNENKLNEIAQILRSEGIDLPVVQLDIDKIEVQSMSIRDVVEVAAELSVIFTPHKIPADGPVLIEDTGLYIDALNQFPGALVKWTLETIGNEGILKLLEGKANRGAKMCTAVACIGCRKDLLYKPIIVTECVEGIISSEERGRGGFGFDSIFIPNGYDKTLAELDAETKNKVSSRALAFRSVARIIKRIQ